MLIRNFGVRGDEEFVKKWLNDLQITALTTLRIETSGLGDPEVILDTITDQRNLQHLHLQFESWDCDWTVPDILSWLEDLPELITLKLLANIPDTGDEPESLSGHDAITIAKSWPKLSTLAVALADLNFFINILQLRHLQDLELNACCWVDGFEDPYDFPCPSLRSLYFSGSPDHWDEGDPGDMKLQKIPEDLKME